LLENHAMFAVQGTFWTAVHWGRRVSPGVVAAVLVIALTATAQAHMVWIETVASPGRLAVHAGFGEPNHWDRRNARKIDQTVYTLRRADGQELPLALRYHPRAECFVTDMEHSGPAAIVATCDFGVSSHGPKPSLILFTAKRYVAEPSDWGRLDGSPKLANLEVLARIDGDKTVLTVISGGKPLAGAEVRFSGPKSDMVKYTTDATGAVVVPSEGPGAYGVLSMRTLPEAGERDGMKYDTKREISTLTYAISKGETAPALKADSEGAATLGKVLKSQSLWGDEFTGFRAKIEAEYQGLKGKGTVEIGADGTAKVEMADAHAELVYEVREWVESMAWHRAQRNVGQPQSQVSAGPPRMLAEVAFAGAGDSNARGTELVPIHDPFASRFWTRNGQLAAAARQIGERKQTITILSAKTLADGRAIPTASSTSFWDLNGNLIETDVESREWVEVSGVLLPAEVRVVSTESAGAENPRRQLPGGTKAWRVMSMRFSEHTLLGK
jgi:hypothetical protein